MTRLDRSACSMCGSNGKLFNVRENRHEPCICCIARERIPPVPYVRGLGEMPPIDGLTVVHCDDVLTGNEDIAQSEWKPRPVSRDCPDCKGAGTRRSVRGARLLCVGCNGFGRVRAA